MTSIQFTGSDLKIAWDVNPPADWVTSGTDWIDPYLRDYRVRLLSTGAHSTIYGTFYTTDRRFVLTKEHNSELNAGTPVRSFTIGVAMRDVVGVVYSEFTQDFDNPAPAAPTILMGATGAGITITVSKCTETDYAGTKVWVSTTPGFVVGSTTATFDAPQTAFTYAATGGTTYYVRAAHYDDYSSANADLNISSQYSTAAGTTGGAPDTTPPATPTSLALSSTLTLDTDGHQLIILSATWTGVGDADLDQYVVALQEAAGAFIEYPVGRGTSYGWVVKANVSYTAKILAVDVSGNRSSYSSTTSHTTTYDTTAPSAPSSLSATGGFQAVFLAWTNASAADLRRVEIYENTTNSSGSATKIDTINATPSAPGFYARNGLATGVTRYYWLKAVDTSGNASGFSSGVNATTVGNTVADWDTTAPAVPAGLSLASTLTVDTDASQIIILTATWTANTDTDLDHYELALQEAAGTFIEYTTSGSTVTYSWVGVKANVSYTVKIRAVDKQGNRSSFSSTINHTTTKDTTAPSAPSSVAATAAITSIFVNWTNPTAADLKSVEVWENTTSSSGSATRIATVDALSAAPGSYTRTGLATAAQRWYWTKAVDTSGNASGFSSSANATTASVNTADIAANAITAALIAAHTITATQITAGTITTTEIAASTIVAGNIAAATITATQIAANTITASRLVVSDDSNMLRDPSFVDSTSAWTVTGATVTYDTSSDVTSTMKLPRAVKIVATAANPQSVSSSEQTLATQGMIVVTGLNYYVTCQVLHKVAFKGQTSLEVSWYQPDATTLISTQTVASGADYRTTPRATSDEATSIGGQLTAPAAAVYAVVRLKVTWPGAAASAGTAFLGAPRFWRAVDANLIVDGTITASKITAGTITGDKIAAGTITTSRLYVGDDSSMVRDVEFADSSYWTLSSGAITFDTSADVTTTLGAARGVKHTASGANPQTNTDATSLFILVEPSKSYRLFLKQLNKIAFKGMGQIGVNWYTQAGVFISASFVSGTDYRAAARAGSDETESLDGIVASPATAYEAKVFCYCDWPDAAASAGVCFQAIPRMNRATDGQLIVDGTITAVKIAANTITASQIAANTITASQIAAATITATQIASSTITATQIAANTITAAKIAAGTITATEIAAATITADKFAASTITVALTLGSSAKITLDGANNRILISD